MTFISIALALGLAGPASGPPRQPAARIAVADGHFIPPTVAATAARRRVGLCVQISGPRVGAARVVAPSRDPAWDAGMLQEVLRMQTPATPALPTGAWIALWIRDPGLDGDSTAADGGTEEPRLDCAK